MTDPEYQTADLPSLGAAVLLALAVKRTIRGLLGPVMVTCLAFDWTWPYRVAVVAWLLAILAAGRGFRMWAANVQRHPLHHWWRLP